MGDYANTPTGELKAIATSAYNAVNVVECFGRRDVIEMEGAMAELERRGYKCRQGLVIIDPSCPECEADITPMPDEHEYDFVCGSCGVLLKYENLRG